MPFSSAQHTSRTLASRADQSSFDRGDVAFIILSGALVSFMIPGLAFLYSGLARRKSALALIWAVAAANAVVVFQWFFWGYSLAFSSTATNGFIGNLVHFGLRGVLDAPSPGSPLIPELLYSFYQMEFACVTVCILMGAVAERGRVFPAMVFTFCWMTLVYCPLAAWAWSTNGWGFTWGVLDYAGGGPVEIGSGMGGLAYSWVLGRRSERELRNFRPHNVSLVALGTYILWFGWLGFNAGSAFGANLRAIAAAWNSMVCAAMGGIAWCALDFRIERKYTMVGFCSGTIAGLVAATPSSGYVPIWASLVVGLLAGGICNYATKLKFFFRIDDALDLFAEHAVGGIIGLLCNAFFGSKDIVALDGLTQIDGGWLDHNWKQLYKQFAYVCATCAYTFIVTALLAKIIDMIPGLHLRETDEAEKLGMDDVQIGEFANDYIELRRHFFDATVSNDNLPPSDDKEKVSSESEATVAAGDRHAVPDTNGHVRQHHVHTAPKEGNGQPNEKDPLEQTRSGDVRHIV
ncbi:putative ammonium transporter [Sistotremastrum suecicum HHB10207 ss-3]|uniref:Ammonium transporter n=1 Tax=Sistotremastrum suecicum HHB10207 ss-3 TaxID=1314776 RepID=A0A166HJB3_9AGAM|nr:putative ammonium transporter [Sistotremastrum suecicum HHB10207 ss-3]